MFVIFSLRITWLCSHWNGARSQPCIDPSEECDGCRKELPTKWKGYFHARSLTTDVEGFVEITPTIGDAIRGQSDYPLSLRGMRIELRRTKGDKGRLQCVLLPCICSLDSLPQEKDPTPVLKQLWDIGGHAKINASR